MLATEPAAGQKKIDRPGSRIEVLEDRVEPIILSGFHPLTGAAVQFVFNEPAPGRKNILMFYKPEKCWFYSEDAGLTSQRVEGDIEPFLYKADVMV